MGSKESDMDIDRRTSQWKDTMHKFDLFFPVAVLYLLEMLEQHHSNSRKGNLFWTEAASSYGISVDIDQTLMISTERPYCRITMSWIMTTLQLLTMRLLAGEKAGLSGCQIIFNWSILGGAWILWQPMSILPPCYQPVNIYQQAL